MDAYQCGLLDQVTGRVETRALLEHALAGLFDNCWGAGPDATALASALGVHRATLYRRSPVTASVT